MAPVVKSAETTPDAAPTLVEPPFQLNRPETLSTPLVFASPHSGRIYPEEMMAASSLDARAIRRSEDAYVDALIEAAPSFGVPVLSARFARAFIDVNRAPYELDPAMFEDDLPAFAAARTARVAAGLGSIARIVADGQEIYRRKLRFDEARQRIERIHQPYHRALSAIVDEVRRRFGFVILVDWHSMPSPAAGRSGLGPVRGPDLVLGDLHGLACAPCVMRAWEVGLSEVGFSVVRNTPYAGGHTTEFYGRPDSGVHALQIEIDRSLYMDERTLERHEGFALLRSRLNTVIAELSRRTWPLP